jgi:hypothetical protein
LAAAEPYHGPDRRHHVARAARFSLAGLRRDVAAVQGVNAKLAVAITNAVGTMACAYVFAAIALISLPAAIETGETIVIVAWVAQTFLQLVLLSIIMVGQRVQASVSEARETQQFEDIKRIREILEQIA